MSASTRILLVGGGSDGPERVAEPLEREDERFVVETASGTTDCFERLSDDVDCVVCDDVRPDATALELVRAVRDERPDLPIVLLVEGESRTDPREAISAGASDCVRTDPGTDQYPILANRIGTLVELSRTRHERGDGPGSGRRGHREERLERNRRELEAERAVIEQALDILDDLFYVVGTDGELRQWNKRFPDVTGYTGEEIANGMAMVDFFPEDHRRRISDAVDDAIESGRRIVEADLLTAEGERVPYEFTGTRLHGRDGGLIGIVGVGRNVSDRKRRMEALTALHERTSDFMSAPDQQSVAEIAVEVTKTVLGQPLAALWLYDEETDSLQGAAATEEAQATFDELLPFERGEGLSWGVFESGEYEVYDDVQAEPDRFNPDTNIRSDIILPLGEYGVINVESTEVGAFDEIDVSLARVLADMVEAALARADREAVLREQRATLERQNERLDNFARIVSHDLRNPLNVAQGRVELARGECDSEHLADADAALDRIAALIDDILTLARRGERVTETEAIDLGTLSERAWRNVDTAAATLVVDAERTILGDPGRVQQLFENFVRNAVEHGGHDVTVTVGDLEDGFFVEDDGPGIPAAERGAVLESGYSTAEDGTGFGLSIVKGIVDAHEWELTVTAAGSGGARFEITEVEFA